MLDSTYIRLQKARKQLYGALTIPPADVIAFVELERIWFRFEGHVYGLHPVYDDGESASGARLTIAPGYRCLDCRKCFFAVTLDGFRHECMEVDHDFEG